MATAKDALSGYSFSQAKAANEAIKVQKLKKHLALLERRHIHKTTVEKMVLQLAQHQRQHWQAWERWEVSLADLLASRWDISPKKIKPLIEQSLAKQFEELGEFRFSIKLPETDASETQSPAPE